MIRNGRQHVERATRRRAGFTIIELLVVTATIAVLVGLILVALSRASNTARRNATAAQLSTIGQAINAFEQEVGYVPPLLTPNDPNWEFGADPYPGGTNSFTVPQSHFYDERGLAGNAGRSAMARTRYMSEFSLTVYLMGIGDLYQPGNNFGGPTGGGQNRLSGAEDDGVEGPGMVNPGRDRSWGGARNRNEHNARPGPVIGPYLDPGQFTDALELVPFDPASPDFPANGPRMYRLVDRFDYPIRYYQGLVTRVPTDAPGVGPDSAAANRITGRYLPPELRSLESWESFLADPAGPTVSGFQLGAVDNDLTGAKWALLSAGQKGEDVDPEANAALSAEREARYFIAPFGDSAAINDQREMFRLEPLATSASQITQFEGTLGLLRRAVESNVRVIGR